jgi:site-specific recombinase
MPRGYSTKKTIEAHPTLFGALLGVALIGMIFTVVSGFLGLWMAGRGTRRR